MHFYKNTVRCRLSLFFPVQNVKMRCFKIPISDTYTEPSNFSELNESLNVNKLWRIFLFQSSTGSSSGVRQPLRYGQSGIRPPSASNSRIARPTTGIPRPGATSRLPAPQSGIPKPGGSNPGSRASSATGRKTSYCYWENEIKFWSVIKKEAQKPFLSITCFVPWPNCLYVSPRPEWHTSH